MAPMNVTPHDQQAEAGALACVLTAEHTRAVQYLDELHEDYFHDGRHLTVFRALLRLNEDGARLDSVALYQTLRDDFEIDDAGGAAYIAVLADSAPSPENHPTYLAAIRKLARRRAMLAEGEAKIKAALDPKTEVEYGNRQSIGEILAACEFRGTNEPPPIQTIFSLAGHTICTPGNLTTITSAVKTGKSAVIGAMVASALPHAFDADLLGFKSSNADARALLLFDSEQSPADFWHCVSRALRRAGLEKPPLWFHAYCLTGLGCKRGWEAVEAAIQRASERHPGIHSIHLDGAADFVSDVNDAAESNDFVAILQDVAIKRNCPITGVIHFNPGSDKSRGHLGSQLERKAETNLALKKDPDESTVIFSTKNRRAGIPESLGPRFRFDTTAGMHVTIESRQAAKEKAERESLMDIARDVFSGRLSMRYSDIQTTVKTQLTVSDRTAERKVAAMKRLAVIKLSAAGLYTL